MITAPQADAMMKALKGAGLTIPVIGGPPLAQAIPLFAAGTKNVDGMYLISTAVTAGPQLPDSYPAKAQVVGFYNAVMAETKAPPDNFAAWSDDAVSLMAEAVTKAGGIDKTAVRDAFESIKGYWGVAGQYNYSATDHVGIHGGMWLFQIKNGEYKSFRATPRSTRRGSAVGSGGAYSALPEPFVSAAGRPTSVSSRGAVRSVVDIAGPATLAFVSYSPSPIALNVDRSVDPTGEPPSEEVGPG